MHQLLLQEHVSGFSKQRLLRAGLKIQQQLLMILFLGLLLGQLPQAGVQLPLVHGLRRLLLGDTHYRLQIFQHIRTDTLKQLHQALQGHHQVALFQILLQFKRSQQEVVALILTP
jgi:hypothetical protein